MMIAALLDDQRELTTKGHIAFTENVSVFIFRDGCVRISANMDDGDMCSREGTENVDGVPLELDHLLLAREVIILDGLLPVAGTTFTFAFAAGPAFHIADGRVAVDATDSARVDVSPAVGVKAATAETLERRFGREAISICHSGVESVEVLHRVRTTKGVAHIGEREMKACFQKCEIGGGKCIPEHGAPNPWAAWERGERLNDMCCAAIDDEVMHRVAVIIQSIAGKRGR